ncbi:MAG: tetratricopeptide repeat protein [Candidatus Eisenbacteria bacterium]|nr:tetratricopeptide repeat protein [Candidatus Eisenbacteria bacterium]
MTRKNAITAADCCTPTDFAEAIAGVALGDLSLAAFDGTTAEQYDGFVTIGQALVAEGKLDKAEPIFQGLLAYVPEDPYLHFALGAIEIQREDYEAAVPHLEAAVARDPDHLRAQCYLFEALLQVEVNLVGTDVTRLDEALQVLAAIHLIDPERKDPLTQRAFQIADYLGVFQDHEGEESSWQTRN